MHKAVRVGQAWLTKGRNSYSYALRRVEVCCRIGIGHLGILARARLDRSGPARPLGGAPHVHWRLPVGLTENLCTGHCFI